VEGLIGDLVRAYSTATLYVFWYFGVGLDFTTSLLLMVVSLYLASRYLWRQDLDYLPWRFWRRGDGS